MSYYIRIKNEYFNTSKILKVNAYVKHSINCIDELTISILYAQPYKLPYASGTTVQYRFLYDDKDIMHKDLMVLKNNVNVILSEDIKELFGEKFNDFFNENRN